MINVAEVTKKLIEIPSFPKEGGQSGEENLAEFIENFFHENLVDFNLYRQSVEGARYNLIATNGDPSASKVIFCCHMDTVDAKPEQFVRGKLVAFEKNGTIAGLGACDMKGGIAALLVALVEVIYLKNGVTIIFYCDEELDFLGMKKIVAESSYAAPLAIFTEPTDTLIADGCRGVIETVFQVRGRTAHAARPRFGINAIVVALKAYEKLKVAVSSFSDDILGSAVCNCAAINGGLLKGWTIDNRPIIGRTGNNVADFVELVVECRTPDCQLDATLLTQMYLKFVEEEGGKAEEIENIHDFGPMKTDRSRLKSIQAAIKKAGLRSNFANAGAAGYYDAQMFSERFNIPCVSFGPGPNEASHRADEYVTIESLEKSVAVYKALLEQIE